jgi:hypothetical protein
VVRLSPAADHPVHWGGKFVFAFHPLLFYLICFQASEILNTVNRLDILNLDEMAKIQEEEEKLENELEDDEEEEEDDDVEETRQEIVYHQPQIIHHYKEPAIEEVNPITIPESASKTIASVSRPHRQGKTDDPFLEWDDFDVEPEKDQQQETQVPPIETDNENQENTDDLIKNEAGTADINARTVSNDNEQQQIQEKQQPLQQLTPPPKQLQQQPQKKKAAQSHPIFGKITHLSKDNNNNPANPFVSPIPYPLTPEQQRQQQLPDQTTSIATGTSNSQNKGTPMSLEQSFSSSLQQQTPLLPIQQQQQVPLLPPPQVQKKKSNKKKVKKKKKKGLNFFGLSSGANNRDEDEEEDYEKNNKQSFGVDGEMTSAPSEQPTIKPVLPAANVGIGLSSLWDDGTTTNDYEDSSNLSSDYYPTNQLQTEGGNDLETGNHNSSNTNHGEGGGGGDGLFGSLLSTLSTTASTTASSASSSLHISKDFLQNPFKKTYNSFFDNLETEIDLEDDPILKQVEWNKKNPHQAMARGGNSNNTASYIASLLPFSTAASNSSSNQPSTSGGEPANPSVLSTRSSSSSSFLNSFQLLREESWNALSNQWSELKRSLSEQRYSAFLIVFIKLLLLFCYYLSCFIGLALKSLCFLVCFSCCSRSEV